MIKNPNSFSNRMKRFFAHRWSQKDTPASEPRFSISLLMKDIVIFIALPIGTTLVFKILSDGVFSKPSKRKARTEVQRDYKLEPSKTQIVDFKSGKGASGGSGFSLRKAPGTLVKVRLLNTVETFGSAPVHAQIMDYGLGPEWTGGTMIGDATSDSNYGRININFRFVKSGTSVGMAKVIKARALSLNGTLGIGAEKKEGFFARSALNAANPAAQSAEKETDSLDVKHFLAKALANGLLQEFGSSSNTERNKSQVYTLKQGEIFFVELTDFFPSEGK